jgi:hypothetical protein
MNKKILIIIIAVIFVLLIGAIIFLSLQKSPSSGNSTSQNSTGTTISTLDSNSYKLSLDIYQASISATLITVSTTTPIDTNLLAQYALVNLNQTNDLVSFFCASPYKPSGATSSTNNKITPVAVLNEISMPLFTNLHNNLPVTCAK